MSVCDFIEMLETEKEPIGKDYIAEWSLPILNTIISLYVYQYPAKNGYVYIITDHGEFVSAVNTYYGTNTLDTDDNFCYDMIQMNGCYDGYDISFISWDQWEKSLDEIIEYLKEWSVS